MKKSFVLLTLCSLTLGAITSCADNKESSDTQIKSEIKINIENDKTLGVVTYENKNYKLGDEIIFKFEPKEGYAVSKLLINKRVVNVFKNEAKFIIDSSDLLVEVEYSQISKINLTYNKDGGEVLFADIPYKLGDTLHLKATPKDGYYLAYVHKDGKRVSVSGEDYLIPINSKETNIDVLFVEVEVKLTDMTFTFDKETKEAVLTSYNPNRNRVPYPFVVPETVTHEGETYKITSISESGLKTSLIKAITLSKNIKEVKPKTFASVYSLENIYCVDDNPNFVSKDGILYSKDQKTLIACPTEYKTLKFSIPESVETIAPYAFLNNRLMKQLIIPNTVKTLNVGSFAYMKSLIEVTLPSEITEIPDHCFEYNTNLTAVVIPSKVSRIGEFAFCFNPQLRSVTFSPKLKRIEREAFNNCQKLTNLNFNEGLEYIGRSAFGKCEGIYTLKFPSTLLEIGDAAFEVCANLEDVKLNEGLKKLGGAVFALVTELSDIELPTTLEEVSYNPFFGNARTKLTIKEGNTHLKVKDGVLFDINETRLISFPHALTTPNREYVIPSTVVEICEDAFGWNKQLTKLTIPKSVKKMYLAFENILPTAGLAGYQLELHYLGTIDEFNAIDHGDAPWNYMANFKDNKVHCLNGADIPLTPYN